MEDESIDEPKEKFLEALEKKKKANSPQSQGSFGNSKVKGGQSGGSTPKMFRRKSGQS